MSKLKKIIAGTRSDDELIEGLRDGDHSKISFIYKSCYPSVEHMIINNKGNVDEAKDIFQEALIVLYDKITHKNFELSSKLNTFLYAVSRRLWLKRLNKKDVSLNILDNDNIDIPEVESDLEFHQNQELKFDQMQSALDQLGEPCKTILTDFYIHSKSMVEISDKFGYTNAENAKNQKYKCLQRLKKLFFNT